MERPKIFHWGKYTVAVPWGQPDPLYECRGVTFNRLDKAIRYFEDFLEDHPNCLLLTLSEQNSNTILIEYSTFGIKKKRLEDYLKLSEQRVLSNLLVLSF